MCDINISRKGKFKDTPHTIILWQYPILKNFSSTNKTQNLVKPFERRKNPSDMIQKPTQESKSIDDYSEELTGIENTLNMSLVYR